MERRIVMISQQIDEQEKARKREMRKYRSEMRDSFAKLEQLVADQQYAEPHQAMLARLI